jgi:hypothetical protein
MFRVALHSAIILALLAAPAACCCTLTPAPRTDSGETLLGCCCCQNPPDAPATPRHDEPGQCNCKQKQSYVPAVTTDAPAAPAEGSGKAVDLSSAFTALTAIDPSSQAAGILPVSGFTSGREALRALMVLRL